MDLHHGKQQLTSLRIAKLIRSKGLRNCSDLLERLDRDSTGAELLAMIDALTTNHTSFFREAVHFEFLRTEVLAWLRKRWLSRPAADLRIWCAASSSGEEPLTILFSLLEALPPDQPPIHVMATDISSRVLDRARNGVYPADALKPLPEHWLQRYFLRGEGDWAGYYRVKPTIASHIHYSRFNLMEPIPPGWTFPVIFCRNVMIYFDRQTQSDVVNRLARALEPGGYLFIGHAESLTGIDHPLVFVRPAVYRRLEQAPTPMSSGQVNGKGSCE